MSRWSLGLIAFVLSLVLSASALPAYAGTAFGAIVSFSAGSYNYLGKSAVVTGTNSATGDAYTAPNGFTANSGWLGSTGRLFTSAGSLSCQSVARYNSGTYPSGYYWITRSCTRGYGGNWYSAGISSGWNGSGSYVLRSHPRSPNQSS